MDPYLRQHIQKRGMSVHFNTYTGFDMEYQNEGLNPYETKLLSVQTATQHRTVIKLPLYLEMDISYIHPLSSEISEVFKNKVDSDHSYKYKFVDVESPSSLSKLFTRNDCDDKKPFKELQLINNSLKETIRIIRDKLYLVNDLVNDEIIDHFKELQKSKPGIEFFIDQQKDCIVFSFPLTVPVSDITFPTKEFSFLNLLNMSKGKGKYDSEIITTSTSTSDSTKLTRIRECGLKTFTFPNDTSDLYDTPEKDFELESRSEDNDCESSGNVKVKVKGDKELAAVVVVESQTSPLRNKDQKTEEDLKKVHSKGYDDFIKKPSLSQSCRDDLLCLINQFTALGLQSDPREIIN